MLSCKAEMFLLISVLPLVLATSEPRMMPDLPKVEVSSEILQRFGILSDVNQQSVFDNLWMKLENNMNGQSNQARLEAFTNTREQLYKNYENMTPIELSLQAIGSARMIGADGLVELAGAHILNLIDRILNISQEISQTTLRTLQEIQTGSSALQMNKCQTVDEMKLAAFSITRELDITMACSRLIELIQENDDHITKLMSESARSMGTAAQARFMIFESSKSTIDDILSFVESSSLIPEMFYPLLAHRTTEAVQDYNDFYLALKSHPVVRQLTGRTMDEVENFFIQNIQQIIEN